MLTTTVDRIDEVITSHEDEDTCFNDLDVLLIDYRSLIRPAKPDLDRILRFAIACGKLPVVRQLLSNHGGNVLRRDTLGRSAIFYLAIARNYELSKLIVDRTCDEGEEGMYAYDRFGLNPLEYAIRSVDEETTAVLLSRGASPYALDTSCNNAEFHRGILGYIGLSRLVPHKLSVQLTVSRRVRKDNIHYLHLCSLWDFQRNRDCWSEHLRTSIRSAKWEHHLTWIHCPTTNVRLCITTIFWGANICKGRRIIRKRFNNTMRYCCLIYARPS
jgi:hypothetical protein